MNFKKNERIYNSANSEVYKMLQEAENDPNEPGERELILGMVNFTLGLGWDSEGQIN